MKITPRYGPTMAYPLLPGLLLVAGWIAPVVAIPVVAVTGPVGASFWRRRVGQTQPRHRWQGVLILGALALFLCTIARMGRLTAQKSDYAKHHPLHDLVRYLPPVGYPHLGHANPYRCRSGPHDLPAALPAKNRVGVSGANRPLPDLLRMDYRQSPHFPRSTPYLIPPTSLP